MATSGDRRFFRLANLLGLVAAFLIAAATIGAGDRALMLLFAEATEGEVVRLERVRRSKGGVYSPVVRFSTASGRTIEFQAGYGTNSPEFSVGERVPVRYWPEAPEDALLSTFFAIWWTPILFVTGGLIMAGFFGLSRRRARRDAELARVPNANGNPIIRR